MQVTAEGVTFRYPGGDHAVLDDLHCTVPSGTTAAILGPSGSGKTTLLALLGGLLAPQAGTLECVDNQGNAHIPRHVSTWVLQTVSLLPDRSALDNVCLGAHLDGADLETARARAAERLCTVGLEDRAHDPARILSGGEAQRVAIARALSSTRPVLFADEPTGQLDATTTDHVLDALFDGADRTVVVVTHDEHVAARCDLVLDLHGGRLVPRSTV